MLPFDPYDLISSNKEPEKKAKSWFEKLSSPIQHSKKLWSDVKNIGNPKVTGFKGFAHGLEGGFGVGFIGGMAPYIATATYGIITAKRGHKLAAVTSGGIGWGITATLGGAIAGAFGIPPSIGAVAAGMVFGNSIDEGIKTSVQAAVDFGSNMRRSSFGGDYRDTQVAVTMRQAAAREMSGSLMNARQWLGSEASFLHQ